MLKYSQCLSLSVEQGVVLRKNDLLLRSKLFFCLMPLMPGRPQKRPGILFVIQLSEAVLEAATASRARAGKDLEPVLCMMAAR